MEKVGASFVVRPPLPREAVAVRGCLRSLLFGVERVGDGQGAENEQLER